MSQEEEEETYGVPRDEFSVDPKKMDTVFKQELQEIVYVDLPKDLDYVERLSEERAVIMSGDNVRAEILTRDHARAGMLMPPQDKQTRMIKINSTYALAVEDSSAPPLGGAEHAQQERAQDEHIFQQRLKKITLKIQADNLIRECMSRIRMGLFLYPKEEEHLRDMIKRASAHRATLPEETTEEMAQTEQAHFHANQLLGLPLEPEKGCQRPVLMKTHSFTGSDYVPKLSKAQKVFEPVVASGRLVKKTVWIANVARGLPYWNCFKNVTFDLIDMTSDHLVTLTMTGHKLVITWYKIITRLNKSSGILSVTHKTIINDVKGALGPAQGLKACDGAALVWFDSGHVLVAPSVEGATNTVHRFSTQVTAAVLLDQVQRLVVGTVDGYLIDGDVTHDMPYRIPIQRLEHQGGGVLLAATRMSVYRFHVHPEIGPYQLNVPLAMGVTGCGALLASMSVTGNVWITNTFAKSQMARSINPPPGISKHVDLFPKKKDKEEKDDDPDNPTKFWQLNYPFEYQYDAIWMGRMDMHILYPDASIRKLTFKK